MMDPRESNIMDVTSISSVGEPQFVSCGGEFKVFNGPSKTLKGSEECAPINYPCTSLMETINLDVNEINEQQFTLSSEDFGPWETTLNCGNNQISVDLVQSNFIDGNNLNINSTYNKMTTKQKHNISKDKNLSQYNSEYINERKYQKDSGFSNKLNGSKNQTTKKLEKTKKRINEREFLQEYSDHKAERYYEQGEEGSYVSYVGKGVEESDKSTKIGSVAGHPVTMKRIALALIHYPTFDISSKLCSLLYKFLEGTDYSFDKGKFKEILELYIELIPEIKSSSFLRLAEVMHIINMGFCAIKIMEMREKDIKEDEEYIKNEYYNMRMNQTRGHESDVEKMKKYAINEYEVRIVNEANLFISQQNYDEKDYIYMGSNSKNISSGQTNRIKEVLAHFTSKSYLMNVEGLLEIMEDRISGDYSFFKRKYRAVIHILWTKYYITEIVDKYTMHIKANKSTFPAIVLEQYEELTEGDKKNKALYNYLFGMHYDGYIRARVDHFDITPELRSEKKNHIISNSNITYFDPNFLTEETKHHFDKEKYVELEDKIFKQLTAFDIRGIEYIKKSNIKLSYEDLSIIDIESEDHFEVYQELAFLVYILSISIVKRCKPTCTAEFIRTKLILAEFDTHTDMVRLWKSVSLNNDFLDQIKDTHKHNNNTVITEINKEVKRIVNMADKLYDENGKIKLDDYRELSRYFGNVFEQFTESKTQYKILETCDHDRESFKQMNHENKGRHHVFYKSHSHGTKKLSKLKDLKFIAEVYCTKQTFLECVTLIIRKKLFQDMTSYRDYTIIRPYFVGKLHINYFKTEKCYPSTIIDVCTNTTAYGRILKHQYTFAPFFPRRLVANFYEKARVSENTYKQITIIKAGQDPYEELHTHWSNLNHNNLSEQYEYIDWLSMQISIGQYYIELLDKSLKIKLEGMSVKEKIRRINEMKERKLELENLIQECAYEGNKIINKTGNA